MLILTRAGIERGVPGKASTVTSGESLFTLLASLTYILVNT